MTAAKALVPLLTTDELSEFIGCSRQSLQRKRKDGTGPKFLRLGEGPQAPIRYRQADVDAWIEEHAV